MVPPAVGLTNWWDARSVSLSSGNVVVWNDLIGNAPFNSNLSGTIPYTSSDTNYGGFPSLGSNGTSTVISTTNTVSLVQPYTYYAIIYYPSLTGPLRWIWDAENNYFVGEVGRTTANHIDNYWSANIQSFGSATNNIPCAVAMVGNGASSQIYVNSSTVGVVTGSGTTNNETSTLTIFAKATANQTWPSGGTIAAMGLASGAATTGKVSAWMSYYAKLMGQSWT